MSAKPIAACRFKPSPALGWGASSLLCCLLLACGGSSAHGDRQTPPGTVPAGASTGPLGISAAVDPGQMERANAAAEGERAARATRGTPEGARAGHRAALARLDANLAANHRFTGFLSRITYDLTTEYGQANAVVERFAGRPTAPGEARINLEYLRADPFLVHHNADIEVLVPEPVADSEWQAMQTVLRGVCPVSEQVALSYPFLVTDQASPAVKTVVRKRIKRLFAAAQHRTQRGEAPTLALFQGTATTPLGELAFDLSQQHRRCIDGLQDGLAAVEERVFGSAGGAGAAHLGEFISQVVTDYKMEFIQRHAELDPTHAEFPTMAVQLLKQKMLYPMGLRGSFMPIHYAGHAHSDHPLLASGRVMERFLAGGTASLGGPRPTVTFEPYTVSKLISLLEAARERAFLAADGARPLNPGQPGAKLSFALLKAECVVDQYAPKDPVAGPSWNEFEAIHLLAEGNAFFEPALPGQVINNVRPTRAFWLHMLAKYAYIVP